MDILRFGKRRDDLVYFIQVNANEDRFELTDEGYLAERGFLYLIYLIAVRPDGVGAMALVKCADPTISALAAQHGLALGCDEDTGYFAGIGSTPEYGAVLAFLCKALEADALLREDQLEVNLLGTYHD